MLPADATVVETVTVDAGAGKIRALVLWMKHPERIVWQDKGYFCERQVYGDHWLGSTRLSLVDLSKSTIVITVEIRSANLLPGRVEDAFEIPFLAPNIHYYVPRPNSKSEGRPTILNLKDLTGERVHGQFVLFEYVACGVVSTSVFGYSPHSDRAVQYPVEVDDGVNPPKTEFWLMTVFGWKPTRPGRWSFVWEPGHGFDGTIHEDVSFDPVRQRFVDRQKSTPYLTPAHPK